MLRKPIALFSSCTHAHSFCFLHPHPCHASAQVKPQRKAYATASHDDRQPYSDEYIWPRSTLSSSIPSPYEILQLKRNAPYTKHCYYRLVKIYHPDRSNQSSTSSHVSSLPKFVRVERYRLIVAAHEILSDPAKRKAYDKTGLGWVERSEWPSRNAHGRKPKWTGFNGNDSPFANATWEDWEKWYERQHGKQQPQAPIYISNVGFITLVLSAVFVGAVGQRLNIERHESFFKERVDERHRRAAEAYKDAAMESRNSPTMDSRIRRFLSSRYQNDYEMPNVDGQKSLPAPGARDDDAYDEYG